MAAEERRELIHQIAARLFSTQGYARTTMDEIAAAAGIKKGSLYHFYAGKEAVLADVLRDAVAIPQARFDGVTRSRLSNVEKLRELIAILVQSYDELLPLMATFTRVSLDTIADERCRAEIFALKRRFEMTWENVVKAAIKQGEMRADLDHKLVAFGIIGMINWMYKWYAPGGRKSAAEVAHTFSTLVLEGLIPRS